MPSRGERESARSDSQRCCQARESAEVRTTSRRSTRVRMLSSTRESGRERRQQVRRLRRRRMWGVGAGLHAPQNSLSGLSLSLRETETRQPAAHCLRGLGCPHSSYSKFILYKEYSCLVIRILEFSINFPAPVIPYITYSIPTTSHGTHMSYTALLFTPHPTLSPAPSSLLSLPHPTYPSVAASLPASYSASHGGPAAEAGQPEGVGGGGASTDRATPRPATMELPHPSSMRRHNRATPRPADRAEAVLVPKSDERRRVAFISPILPPSGGAVLSSSCGGGGLAGACKGGGLLYLSAESARVGVEAAAGGAPTTASRGAGEGRRGCWASLSLRPSGRRRCSALASPSHLPCDSRVAGHHAGCAGPTPHRLVA
jgi:hypothetical protein